MAQALVKISDLGQMFQSHADEINALAPRGLNLERFQVGVVQAWRQNPALQQCSPISVKIAVMEALAAGVIPGGMPPMGWFIPYKNECTWQTSWQGVVYQMQKYGGLIPGSLQVMPVFEGDHFRLRHTDEGVKWEYELRTNTENYETLRGVFVIGEFESGAKPYLYVRKETIERCRSKSKVPGGAWKSDTFGMAMKTAILQYAKDKPRTPDLELIFQREMQREYGEGWNFHNDSDTALPAIAEPAALIEEAKEGNGSLPGMAETNPAPASAGQTAKAIAN